MVKYMAKKSNKGIYIAALILFLGGFSYLVFSGLSQDSVYFLNVSEAMAMERSEINQARLFGKVAGEDIERESLGVAFSLVDKVNSEQSIRVDYRGAVPDTFKPGAEVIVEGSFDAAGQVFEARTLITKCPSKYKSKSEEMEEGD